MDPVRVVVVDDSSVVRKVVTSVLAADPDIEVVGTAANGRIGVDVVRSLRPDVVVLDIEMPELDGLGALEQIRAIDRTLPVIMFSTLTERGASATLDALARGATDYVTKPSNTGSIQASVERLRVELVPRVRQLGRRRARASERPAPQASKGTAPPAPVVPIARRSAPSSVQVLAIGLSTGGPNALGVLLPALPADLPVPVVVVQHMPPTFTRLLAERLDRVCPLRVQEAEPRSPLRPGTVWIAPGDHHMVVRRAGAQVTVEVNQDAQENSCRPAVDPLFRSVASVYGAGALGAVLTGMGRDGLQGSQAIVAAGGQVVVQDEDSSVVWGMPGFVARAGLASAVVPLESFAAELVSRIVSAPVSLRGARR